MAKTGRNDSCPCGSGALLRTMGIWSHKKPTELNFGKTLKGFQFVDINNIAEIAKTESKPILSLMAVNRNSKLSLV